MQQQQGDVILEQTPDGGEITVSDGLVTMNGGLETAAYLSMFGGNEDDDGRADNPLSWWGNLDETEPARQYRSETQHITQSLPLTSNNLRRLEQAANRDLEWLVESRVASSVSVEASIPALNTVKIVVEIEARGEMSRFEFVENWTSSNEYRTKINN